MNWSNNLNRLAQISKSTARDMHRLAAKAKNLQSNFLRSTRIQALHNIQSEREYLTATLVQSHSLGVGVIASQDNLTVARNVLKRFTQGNTFWPNQIINTDRRCFSHNVDNDFSMDRKFLSQLWVADRKLKKLKAKRQTGAVNRAYCGDTGYDKYSSFKPILKQPPVSQSLSGLLQPTSPEEAQIAPLLARSNLLITRDIEWANLVLGFEQENRYGIVDVCYPQSPVGLIREQSNILARQLLRTRRPFVALITDAMGNELFRVRRPFWWITSSIFAEVNGQEIGVVHRRWHLWRRVYDLYLGDKQFAVVENPGFWNWTFTLKDIDGEVLAEVDRDWRGFGFEIFTDAGQYVIRFGSADPRSKTDATAMIQELEVKRPLTLSERAVAVALAISLDNDYFSRHGGGWGIPFVAVGE